MTASFGQLIKEKRIVMGLTQQRLADLVGRSPSTVRSWERDRAIPNDTGVLASLAAVLGIEPESLAASAGLEWDEQPTKFPVSGLPSESASDGTPEPAQSKPDTEDRFAEGRLWPDVMSSEELPAPVEASVSSEPSVFIEAPDADPSVVEGEVEPEIGVQEDYPASGDEPPAPQRDEPDRSDPADEPTQILAAGAEDRLLGVATAKSVEYLAPPRPRTVVEPEPTEVIERAPVVEIEPTARVVAVPLATTPLATTPVPVTTPAREQRTQTLEQERPVGADSYLDDPREIRGYRIRAALTTGALLVMFLTARWAWAGFREQLAGILDTITTGF